jgi:hypothetical protein
MDEATAEEVVAGLRARRIFASVNRRAGVYNVGVRVVIPDGREAIWDNDGAAGLEAMVLRDGVLVGFVPQLPDSADLDAARITEIIAGTDYDAPPPPPARPSSTPGADAGAAGSSAPATPLPPPRGRPAGVRSGWRQKFRRG